MRGLVRLLFMFGPMIFRQIQKYQRNKERQQYRQGNQRQQQPPQQQEARRRSNRPVVSNPPPPPPKQPELTEEEKNFKLKEEDFMLDNTILETYEGVAPDADLNSEALPEADVAKDYLDGGSEQTAEEPVSEEDILDLKNVFFNKEEGDSEESETKSKA